MADGPDVRAALADESCRRVLGHFIFRLGGAVAHGPETEREAGTHDLARVMLAHLRRYAPQATAGLYLEWTGKTVPADMVVPKEPSEA